MGFKVSSRKLKDEDGKQTGEVIYFIIREGDKKRLPVVVHEFSAADEAQAYIDQNLNT